MKKGLFVGTFDPISLGHMDLIKRAATICDTLYIAVAENIEKSNKAFSLEERSKMLEIATKDVKGVELVTFSGLAVNYAHNNQIDFLIRGLRAFADHEEEFQMAITNRKIGNIETLFLLSGEGLSHISSRRIKELAKLGHRLQDFVPAEIEEYIFQRLYQ